MSELQGLLFELSEQEDIYSSGTYPRQELREPLIAKALAPIKSKPVSAHNPEPHTSSSHPHNLSLSKCYSPNKKSDYEVLRKLVIGS